LQKNEEEEEEEEEEDLYTCSTTPLGRSSIAIADLANCGATVIRTEAARICTLLDIPDEGASMDIRKRASAASIL